MTEHEIHEHHEKSAHHHEQAAIHLARRQNIPKLAIMKRRRIIPRSRMAIICTPPNTTNTLRKNTPTSTAKQKLFLPPCA